MISFRLKCEELLVKITAQPSESGLTDPYLSMFKADVIEALRRSKFKFSGHQKIFVSKKFSFTKWDREEYQEMREKSKLRLDGVNVKYTRICAYIIVYFSCVLSSENVRSTKVLCTANKNCYLQTHYDCCFTFGSKLKISSDNILTSGTPNSVILQVTMVFNIHCFYVACSLETV